MSHGHTPSPSGKGWRVKMPAGSGSHHARIGRGKRFFRLFAIVLALAGAVIGLILLLRGTDHPSFLSIAIHKYDESPPLPINGLALQDSRLLQKAFLADRVKWDDAVQTRESLLRELDLLD